MHSTRFVLHLAPAALLLTACESTAPHPMQRLNLSATIGSAATPSATGPFADVIISGTGGSVRITSAQVVLSHIELASDAACASAGENDDNDAAEEADTSAHADTSHADATHNDEHDCEIHVDPVLVSLPMDGSTKVILDALVPAGTYTGLRAKLEAVENDDDGANPFLTANPDFAGVSVKVVGVFTDAGGTDHAFTFTSDAEAKLRSDFASPVTVDASSKNLTVDIDVSTWFKDASGAIIDPTNAANKEAIEHAIRASLRAFEDDNHDGHDDHGEGGDGGH